MRLTYLVRVICSNCGEYQDVEILKGVTVNEFLPNYKCSTCECHESFKTTPLSEGIRGR